MVNSITMLRITPTLNRIQKTIYCF